MNELISRKIDRLISLFEEKNFYAASILISEIAPSTKGPATKKLLDALCKKYEFCINNNTPRLERISLDNNINLLSQLDSRPLLPGVTIVSCCMNRNENLKKGIHSWLQLPVDEIIIVDWSSKIAVSETLSEFKDPRIKIIRVDNEEKWVLTYAFNVGLRAASHEKIFKLDADIETSPDFLTLNNFSENEFVRGYWKSAIDSGKEEQKYVNGSFGCHKKHLLKIGFYNEFIRTYGWDDSDIYTRLAYDVGLKTKYLATNSILHMEQEQSERLKNQDVSQSMFFDKFEATEFYNIKNRYQVALGDDWNASKLADYKIQINNTDFVLRRITPEIPIANNVTEDAAKYAALKLASWFDTELETELKENTDLIKLVVDNFYDGVPFSITKRFIKNSSAKSKFDPNLILINDIRNGIPDTALSQGFIGVNGLPRSMQIEIYGKAIWLVSLDKKLNSGTEFANNSRVFITSLYDERREERLNEYLYCIEENCKQFDSVVIFYEKTTAILYEKLRSSLVNKNLWEKVIFIYYAKRPTFELMFDTADVLFHGSIIFISNADIAVDESIKLINPENIKDCFFTISRNEVDLPSKKSKGLLMNQLGIPNTFSADMWIYQSPRKYKFKSNFDIGTFHCDSFMNYYINKSGYRLFNPCLDINLYHIHNPEFNSSEDKAIRLKDKIEKKFREEVEFNDGEYPLKGAKWSRLSSCLDTSGGNNYGTVNWYNTALKIHINDDGSNLMQALSAAILASEVFANMNFSASVWLMLPSQAVSDLIYNTTEQFLSKVNFPHVYIGVNGDLTSLNCNQVFMEGLDLISTVQAVRNRQNCKFFGSHISLFSNKDDTHALDRDPCLVFTVKPTNSDIESYKLLRALTPDQLKFFTGLLSENIKHKSFTPLASDLNFLSSNMGDDFAFKNQPSISFITSVFKGAEFMRGYLENIAAAALEVGGEVIIIDANSPQNEFEIYQTFISDHPECENIFKYIKLDKDPGLYNCWKLGIQNSNAEFVSNANLDDRRSPFQARILLEELKCNPGYAGVASAIRATRARNTAWYHITDNEYWFETGFDQTITFENLYIKNEMGLVKSQNIMHCMPVWHKSLHEKYGFFDEEKYGTSADWAFWLECTKNGEKFLLVPQPLSQYFINEKSHNRINDTNGEKERKIIKDYLGVTQHFFVQQ